jgi:hypothetical protein
MRLRPFAGPSLGLDSRVPPGAELPKFRFITQLAELALLTKVFELVASEIVDNDSWI